MQQVIKRECRCVGVVDGSHGCPSVELNSHGALVRFFVRKRTSCFHAGDPLSQLWLEISLHVLLPAVQMGKFDIIIDALFELM